LTIDPKGCFSLRVERLPGFRDFFPDPLPKGEEWSADVREYIFERWKTVARSYTFQAYDGPPLEFLDLYTVKSGEEIVSQLYNFTDKGDRAAIMRATVGVISGRIETARSPLSVKLYS
jgi:histidyl-tRNA synthetase